jgi:hypothetical protein
MPEKWKRYLVLGAVRCATFYLAIALVQLMFDDKIAWVPDLFPAVAFAILATYVQARLAYIKQLAAQRRKKK